MNNKYFIDLFAGCGGLSLGLEQAGFIPIYVNELNNDAMDTYLTNRTQYLHLQKYQSYDIKSIVDNKTELPKLKKMFRKDFNLNQGDLGLIVGGPPCQGYSGIGHRRSYAVDKNRIPSNYLYKDMVHFINYFQPKIFLFENVRGLLNSRWTKEGKKGEIWNDVINSFSTLTNYKISNKLIKSYDYGVPQNRPRVFIIGFRDDIKFNNNSNLTMEGMFPEPDIKKSYPDIEDILGDLIDEDYKKDLSTEIYTNGISNPIQRYYRKKKNKNTYFKKGEKISEMIYSNHSEIVNERFKYMIDNNGLIPAHLKTKKFAQRLLPKKWKNYPNITITGTTDDYVHFSQPRTLTVREWARLQGFPDWYQFCGPRTTGGIRRAGNPQEGILDRELPKYTQIGNAVPVKLAFEIGLHFKKILDF